MKIRIYQNSMKETSRYRKAKTSSRAIRSGSFGWFSFDSRVPNRNLRTSSRGYNHLGFRIAKNEKK